MDDILSSLKFSYIVVPLCVIIAIILMFVDSKINKKVYTKQDYLKISILITVIVGFVVYIHNIRYTPNEEILLGNPPF